jgi:hypothetical protein
MEKTPESAVEQLDARWFNRISDEFFEDYEKLSGNGTYREEQKRAFLAGEIEVPALDYPELENFDFDKKEQALLALKEDVLLEERNPTVQKIYRTKINEMLASVRMLAAAKEGNDKKFSRYGEFIHGKPTASNTAYVSEAIGHKIRKVSNPNQDQLDAANRLTTLLSRFEVQVPEGAVTRDVLPEGTGIKGYVNDSAEAVECMQQVLDELEIDDWKIVVDTEKGLSNFSVSQEYKTINIPSDEQIQARKLTKKKLAGLVEHELKTHIVRRHNGERSKLALLGMGLDRYIKGEEGVATYAEQKVTGATEFAGIPMYFAIAVAKGFDGTPRNFRDTFTVMRDYYVVTQKPGDGDTEKAESAAWKDCVRIFRGTTGKTPGAVFTKDLAYLGNRDIWQLVSINSDVVMTFSIGKFDSTNGEHVAALIELGILDDDLVRLNKDE